MPEKFINTTTRLKTEKLTQNKLIKKFFITITHFLIKRNSKVTN